MRNSKQIQSKTQLLQLQSLSKLPIPELPPPNLQHKFKNLRKTFLLNKPNFKQIIRRQNQTSYSITRKLNTLVDKEISPSEYLISLKKAYDGVSQLSLKKQTQTLSLKQQVTRMRRELEYKNHNKQNELLCLKEVERNHQKAKQKQQESVTQSKTLEHMLERSKNDETIAKIKIKTLDKELKRIKEEVRVSEAKKLELSQLNYISCNMTKQILDIHTQKNQQRKSNKLFYKNHLRQRKQLEDKEKEQHKITQQIQALAASDWNDSNIQKWKKLLFVELTLRKMLLFKIKNLEKKYKKDKDAFHKIRVKTQLEDPKGITQGFYRMGSTITSLYDDIDILEQKQVSLKQYKEKLSIEYQLSIEEYYEVSEPQNNTGQQQQLFLKRKETESFQKYFETQLLEQKLYRWWNQNSNKFRGSVEKAKVSKNIEEVYPIQNLGKYLIEFCEELMRKHQDINKESKENPLNLSELLSMESVVNGNMERNYDEETETEGNKKTRFKI